MAGHPKIAVSGDPRCFDRTTTHLLPPSDIGSAEGMRAKAEKLAAFGFS
jgi:hypothetical protein